ncbi:9224_t:CDS:2 [Gigaspora margarita]|uniref:9224_t:CDS:1 n=1 Tax=Gigaspora margarita TaxID=4874 RepID=A0ABM8W1S7_GIGMA|nr:9224_t:CDS:2 [Gigaspora margarita]
MYQIGQIAASAPHFGFQERFVTCQLCLVVVETESGYFEHSLHLKAIDRSSYEVTNEVTIT